MKTVPIRLNDVELALLDDLTAFKNMPSRSHTIRALIVGDIIPPKLKPHARDTIQTAASQRRQRSAP